jgi:hypothetical protein
VALHNFVHHGVAQRSLVGEVVVQRPLGDPGLGQDGVQTRGLESPTVYLLERGVQQLLPGGARVSTPLHQSLGHVESKLGRRRPFGL